MINVFFLKPSGEGEAHISWAFQEAEIMPVLSASDLHSAPKRHRAQQENSQGPLPRTHSVQRHHSKLSSFQSPWGNQAKSPSSILKVGERSQWTPSHPVGRLEGENSLQEGQLQGSASLWRVHSWVMFLPCHNHYLGKLIKAITEWDTSTMPYHALKYSKVYWRFEPITFIKMIFYT